MLRLPQDNMRERFEVELKKAEAKVQQKGLFGIVGKIQKASYGLYEDEEAQVYLAVITDPLTYNYDTLLGKLLTEAFRTLQPKQTVTASMFNPLRRRLPRGRAKYTSPYTHILMGTLCIWVTKSKKQNSNSARARFIAGLNEYCIKILSIEDSNQRIKAWQITEKILKAVAGHRLSKTMAFMDSAKETLQSEEAESHVHYAPTLRKAKEFVLNNIKAEKIGRAHV